MGDIVRSAEMWFYKPFEGKYVASSPSEDIKWRIHFVSKAPTLVEKKRMCRVSEPEIQWYSLLTDGALAGTHPKHLNVEIDGKLYEFVVEAQAIDQRLLANEYSLAPNSRFKFQYSGKGTIFNGVVINPKMKGAQVPFRFKMNREMKLAQEDKSNSLTSRGNWWSNGIFTVQSIASDTLNVRLLGMINTRATIALVSEHPNKKVYWPEPSVGSDSGATEHAAHDPPFGFGTYI